MHVDADLILYHRVERDLPPCSDTISGYTGPFVKARQCSQRSVSSVPLDSSVVMCLIIVRFSCVNYDHQPPLRARCRLTGAL